MTSLWNRRLALGPVSLSALLALACNASAPNTPASTTAELTPTLPPQLVGSLELPVGLIPHGDGLSSGSGILGVWQGRVASDGLTTLEPVAGRSGAALGDVYIVNIDEYMGGGFCGDCVRVAGMGRPTHDPVKGDTVEVIFEARHPIPLPPELPTPGPKDRLDLHVHDVQAILIAEGNNVFTTKTKLIRGENVLRPAVRLNPSLLVNADGYTSQLDPDIDNYYPTNSNVHPYKILFEDPTNGNYNPAIAPINGYPDLRNPTGHNVMPMGAGYRATPFQFFVAPNSVREFVMVVSCSYGISAQGRGTDIGKRMNPRYFLPLFNLKEPWKVKAEVISNNLIGSAATTSAQVRFQVWDWQQTAQVDPIFNGGSSNLNRIDRPSKLRSAEVEVPSLGFSKILTTADFSGNGQESTPLTATVTINNAALAAGGDYWGLVAIRDDLDNIESNVRAFGKDLSTIYQLRDFSTYQTFLLTVAPAPNPPVAIIQTTPSPAVSDAQIPIIFDGSASFDTDGSIVSYAWDFNYSGNPQNFQSMATGAVVNYAYPVPGVYTAALAVTDNNSPPLVGFATVQVTVNCPSSVPVTCSVTAPPTYTGFSVNTGWSLDNGKLDIAFLPDGRAVFEDNKVLVAAPVSVGTAGAPVPIIPGYPGQHIGSIDVDRQGRIIWVSWQETTDAQDELITTLDIGPLQDKHAGMGSIIHVVEKQPNNQWVEVAAIDVNAQIHAVDTDELDNIWFITAAHKLRKINDNLVMTSFNVDLDEKAGYAPVYNIGEVFDMAIDFRASCFLVLTTGMEQGSLDNNPNYRGGVYANVWRFECDGSYSTTTSAGHPNPLRDLLIIPPTGYPFMNFLGFDALADIEVDNFSGAGYGSVLNGEQNCQVIVGGSGLVAGEGIRIASTFARLSSDLGQDSSILIPTTVGLRALAIKPDGSNQMAAIAADTNATQVLEFYDFLGGWN